MSEKSVKSKKVLKIILNVFFYLIIALIVAFDVFALVSKFSMKSETGAMNFFGHETRIVLTGSMEGDDGLYIDHPEYKIKKINVHDAIFIDTVPADEEKQEEFYQDIKVGDVLTFIYQKGGNVVVTHRVVKIDINEHHYIFTMRGDNPKGDNIIYDNDQYTQTVYSDRGEILGKVTGTNGFLGNLLYELSSNKLVLILIVIIPASIFALYEIGKIIFIIFMNKKEKQLALINKQQQDKLDELEKLRQEVEELKKNQKGEDHESE